MTPLPPPLGSGELVLWRLDQAKFGHMWDSGEGSYLVGGRWSSRGVRAVYASLDPATAILEVAVHKTFKALDTAPHVLTWARITDPRQVHVINAADVPDPNWLKPGAIGVFERGSAEPDPELPGYERLDERTYGAARVLFLRLMER